MGYDAEKDATRGFSDATPYRRFTGVWRVVVSTYHVHWKRSQVDGFEVRSEEAGDP